MPPGRWGGRRTGPMFGASVAGILNSTAESDSEARRRVVRLFGSLLAALFILDIGCAFATLYLVCTEDDEHEMSTAECLKESIAKGIYLHPVSKISHHDTTENFGDLFLLSIVRCIVTLILLKLGIRYGRPVSTSVVEDQSQSQEASVSDQNNLQEPLLAGEEGDFEDENSAQEENVATSERCIPCNKFQWLSPSRGKNLVFATLFLTSTIYQVYAGLKVSTTTTAPHHNFEHSVTILLLCLTVLWINAQAFVFRTLLAELTREDALYLPPEVHRHPMYFQAGGGQLSMHWCDLCRQRIKPEEKGVYRCSLCDFDVCLKCAKRNDSATVGENVLRGDRGVRVETSLSTMGYFRRSLDLAKSELPLLLLSFCLLAASSVSRLLLPHFQGHIIDKVIPQEGENGETMYDKAGFLRYIKIYVLLMLVQGAISTIYSAIFTLVSRRLKFTIRNSLLEKILVQDMAYFDGTESGRLISRLTNDLDLMMSPIQSSLSSLLSNVLILFGGMVMCFYKSYRLSMLAFVTVGPISYLWQQYALWSKGLAREMLSHWAEGNSIASQALSHVRTVKAFGCENKVLDDYSEANEQALHCGIKDAWGNGVTSALTGYLDLGSGVLILYFGGLLVYNGELSVGELVTFQLFWNMMNNAYQNLQGLITSFTRSAAGAEKIFSLWDSEPDIDPKKGCDIDWQLQGHLQLQDVTFYYQMRPDNVVLESFSLDIPAGKTIALVGRSGGGKSTIINLLLRFYDPKGGKLILDGKDYENIRVNQLRRSFGVVTQETELFALTVEENIAFGLKKDEYTMEDVISAAKKAYAHEFISEMKDGYQTRIGERGNRLSGGQRQRLAIARVFLRRPKIILLDEATSALDENSQEAVHKALSNLIAESKATVVLVAHRLSTVVNADSICVIDQGKVLEQGNHEELVAHGGVYASMVEKQTKKRADLLEQEEQGLTTNQNKAEKEKSLDDIDSLLDTKE